MNASDALSVPCIIIAVIVVYYLIVIIISVYIFFVVLCTALPGLQMDHCPQLLVPAYIQPCLAHFRDLLSTSHRGRNIKAQSVSSLLKVGQLVKCRSVSHMSVS